MTFILIEYLLFGSPSLGASFLRGTYHYFSGYSS